MLLICMVHFDIDTKHFSGEWIRWLGRWTAAINQKDVMTFMQGKYPSGSELFVSLSRESNVRTLNLKAPTYYTVTQPSIRASWASWTKTKHLQLISTEGFKNYSSSYSATVQGQIFTTTKLSHFTSEIGMVLVGSAEKGLLRTL